MQRRAHDYYGGAGDGKEVKVLSKRLTLHWMVSLETGRNTAVLGKYFNYSLIFILKDGNIIYKMLLRAPVLW